VNDWSRLPDPNEIGIAIAIAVGTCRLHPVGTGSWPRSSTRTSASTDGSIGTSNVWRTYGRWYGVPVVLLDA